MNEIEENHETEAEMQDMGLDDLEKDVLRSFNDGNWRSVPNSEEMRKSLKRAAEDSLKELNREHKLTVTLAGRDFIGIRGKAIDSGVSYEELIASVLHKYAAGELVERDISVPGS